MIEEMKTLQRWVDESEKIVFFGGAGVSTESGIKDFRSVDGLYSQKFEYPPETIISHTFYERKPEYFFRFYREKMLPLGFEPNVTHQVLARWEAEGKLSARRSFCAKRPIIRIITLSTAHFVCQVHNIIFFLQKADISAFKICMNSHYTFILLYGFAGADEVGSRH